ncbi:MAG TPA: ATP-binding protein, partial [Oculatellaceae cyanobacterium]
LKAVLQNLQKTQAQLIQAEKMSSLGQMVAGIAHEINNPVSFIYSNLEHVQNYTQDLLRLVQLYQQQCPKPNAAIQDETEAIELDFLADDLPKTLDSMQRGAERISQIVLSLRNFSRLDESETKPANIHEGIDNVLLILNHRLHFHILLVNEKIKIIKLYNDLPKIECYPALLNQVFMNILNNAIDALEEARNKTATVDNFSPTIWIHTETVDANYIKVRIQNNGTGIPPELKDKLFDPFFTTKDVGKGTGLGLAICYQIIEKHGGKIEVISEPGLLTEFAIALPVKQSFQ